MKLASAARCSIGLQQLVCKALTRLRSAAAGQKTGHNFTHVTEAETCGLPAHCPDCPDSKDKLCGFLLQKNFNIVAQH